MTKMVLFSIQTMKWSDKSQQLEENSKIAILFHWAVLQRQVRIEGTVSKVSKEQSEAYFHSRDRSSQIGAWASKQSQVFSQENELKDRVKRYEEKFKGQEVPLPEFWGGWQVKPNYFEFWQGRASRLHDRLCFKASEQGWDILKRHP